MGQSEPGWRSVLPGDAVSIGGWRPDSRADAPGRARGALHGIPEESPRDLSIDGVSQGWKIPDMKSKDPLDSVLEAWRPEGHVREDFREAVWSRISTRTDEEEGSASLFAGFRRSGFAQAMTASAAAVVLGTSLGLLAPESSAESEQEAYFTRINPLSGVR